MVAVSVGKLCDTCVATFPFTKLRYLRTERFVIEDVWMEL